MSSKTMTVAQKNLRRDVGILITSVVVAVLLADSGALTSFGEWRFLGAFIAGIFFVSVFTVAPSAVVLANIAATSPVLEVALFAGLGGLVGDLLIFRFVEDRISKDILGMLGKSRRVRFLAFEHSGFVRWLAPLVGALIVASPFPDEIGLAMMGLGKMKTALFIPLTFALDFLGILVLGLATKGGW